MKHASKFLIALTFACLALTGRGYSNNYYDTCTEPCALYSGGLWVGGEFASDVIGGWSLMAGYYNECFLADIGYSYQGVSLTVQDRYYGFFYKDTIHFNVIRSHLGLRNRVCCTNLFLTYGAQGTVGIVSSGDNDTVYEVGAFVGLDYQFTQHYMISGKIAPYTYTGSDLGDNNHIHKVFNSGSITIAYIF